MTIFVLDGNVCSGLDMCKYYFHFLPISEPKLNYSLR